jgi:hypothetical protein
LRWIESLNESDAPAAADGGTGDRRPRISTDPRTGARSVTLPLPDPATVQRLAEGLSRLLAGLALNALDGSPFTCASRPGGRDPGRPVASAPPRRCRTMSACPDPSPSHHPCA